MARTSRRMRALALLLLLVPLAAHAQLSSVPNLSTATEANGGSSTAAQTTGQTNAQTTDEPTQAKTTGDTKTTDQSTFELTGAPQLSTGSSSANLATAGSLTESAFHLTGLPTIAGAGIPTLVIPYTGNAPFMQKSSLPEGTFFIAVGGTLAFFGACVLLWRGLVAWSVNRSVKRTAIASMQLNEKPRTTSYWGGSNNHGYNRVSTGKGSFYKDLGANSTVSLDNLTSAGKVTKPHFRDSVTERTGSGNAPPTNLFFSPTAQAASQRDSTYRNSSGYMPSGFYASPSSQAAGGHTSATIGGLAPGHNNTQRYSAASAHSGPSPPPSPSLPPQSRGSGTTYRNTGSRDGLRAPSRDGLGSSRNSTYLYAQPSSSSLMVGGASTSDLAGSRAPSAYLEDLFENHGNGPRERF